MHGYFVDQNLHAQAQLISQPDLWQDSRQKRIRERVEKERESRIRGLDKKQASVKVNKSFAERLQQQEAKRDERNELRKVRRALKKSADKDPVMNDDGERADAQHNENVERPTALTDPRFASVFADEDFAVDESSREYQALNSGGFKDHGAHEKSSDPSKRLTAVEQEDLSDDSARYSSSGDSALESDEKKQIPAVRHGDGDSKITSSSYTKPSGKKPDFDRRGRASTHSRSSGPQMFVTKSSSNGASKGDRQYDDRRSFGTRLASLPEQERSSKGLMTKAPMVSGEKAITFAPGSGKKQRPGLGKEGGEAGEKSETPQRKNRRSASGNVFRRM